MMTLEEARAAIAVSERAGRLFADGYRAIECDDWGLTIFTPEGKSYEVDLLREECSCPYAKVRGNNSACKHLLGWEKLLSDQKAAMRFPLGQTLVTPGAADAFEKTGEHPLYFLLRHQTGDWGRLDEADKKENELSVEAGLRILSAYHLSDGTRIWVITEADRSSTCLLLPQEY